MLGHLFLTVEVRPAARIAASGPGRNAHPAPLSAGSPTASALRAKAGSGSRAGPHLAPPNRVLMDKIFDAHSLRTFIRVVAVVILLFVMVNLFS